MELWYKNKILIKKIKNKNKYYLNEKWFYQKTNKINQKIQELKIIKKLKNRDLLEGRCSSCYNKYICGGCRARAYARTGNFLEGDDACVDYIKNK